MSTSTSATIVTASRRHRSTRTAELFDLLGRCDPHAEDVLRDELVLINRGVAQALARRYRDRGAPIEDLYQVAYEGLVKAVRRFAPGLGNDFLTFAVPTIRGELQRQFRDREWTIRPPRRVQELQWCINHTLDAMTHELGHEPSHAELIHRLQVTECEYAEAVNAFGCGPYPRIVDTGLITRRLAA